MKKTTMKRMGVRVLLTAFVLSVLALPAQAAGFTPSVENKEAPAVSAVTTQSGEEVAAIIKDSDGNEVIGVPIGDLTVTPVSQAHEAHETVRDTLTDAYEQINSVSSLTELSRDLEAEMRRQSADVRAEDLVVRDLFDVTVTGECKDYLDEDGHSVTIQFDIGVTPDKLLIVLHNYQGDEWETVPSDRIERHADGSVSVTFYSLSPVAFVVDSAEVTVSADAPTSPQTSDVSVAPVILCAAALGVAAAAFFVLACQKKYRA